VAFVLKINGRDKERGKYSVWLTLKAATVEDARAEYHTEMARHESKEPAPPKKENPLWQDVVDRYRREELPGLKESTQSTYGSALNHVSKAFRNRPVRTLSHEDIKAFHLSMSETPRQANVCVNLCGIILDRCEFWRYRDLDSNPVRYLRKSSWKKNREPQRKRKWKPGELEQLGAALQTMQATESPYPIAAVRLLIFTGKRLREILDLQWDQIDLESRTITWEETKTGEMEAPLNDWALEVLQSLPRLKYKDEDGTVKDHPFVLPGAEPGASIRDLTKFWNRLLKLAGITNLHRHDLRHLHGHESAGLGQNPQTTAALLGHSDFASTARYSKTDHDPALEASQKVAGSLAGKMKGGRK
jgi:integrase